MHVSAVVGPKQRLYALVKNIMHVSYMYLLSLSSRAHMCIQKFEGCGIGLLSTSSQSHVSRNCMYNEFPKDTDPKRADLYSLGVLMVYMYKGEPKKNKAADWKRKTSDFKSDAVPAMVKMWEEVVSKCLNIDQFPSLTVGEVVSALDAVNLQ